MVEAGLQSLHTNACADGETFLAQLDAELAIEEQHGS